MISFIIKRNCFFFIGFSSFFYLCNLLINCIGYHQDYKFLRYKVFTKKEFISKLSQIFQSNPKLILRATAYHASSPTINIEGFIHKDGVATVEDTFSFLSQRDISGTFRLPYTNKKIMIMEFRVKIIVAEDGTADDINKKTQELVNSVKNYDESTTHYTIDSIEGFDEIKNCVVILSDRRPCFYGWFWYWLFTLIPSFNACYMMRLNAMSMEKEFILKKVISSRSDLYTEEKNNVYNNQSPKIFVGEEEVNLKDYTPVEVIDKCENSNVKEFLLDKPTLIPGEDTLSS